MNYYLGIDGGGSKSKAVLCDEELKILSSFQAGPSNFLKVGLSEATDQIINLISSAENYLNCSPDKVSIVLGTAGAGRKENVADFTDALKVAAKSTQILPKNLFITGDINITLHGAFEGGEGLILIVGTGSIIYGKTKHDKEIRKGGFGRLIGDEGSGYSIGRKTINFLSKSFDGRIISTPFFEFLIDQLKIRDSSALINSVYKNNYEISQAAEFTIEAAEKGMGEAEQILSEESDELILLIGSSLNEFSSKSINLCLSGGLIEHDNFYRRMLIEKIEKYFPQVKLSDPKHSPEFGAVLMAKEFFGGK